MKLTERQIERLVHRAYKFNACVEMYKRLHQYGCKTSVFNAIKREPYNTYTADWLLSNLCSKSNHQTHLDANGYTLCRTYDVFYMDMFIRTVTQYPLIEANY